MFGSPPTYYFALTTLAAESSLGPAPASPQEASLRFFAPVAAAYVVVCLGWIALRRWRRSPRVAVESYRSTRPWTDLGLALLAAVGILLMGAAYRAGWLIPSSPTWFATIAWQLNNVLIFSPIALVLLLRRQPLRTIYVGLENLAWKIAEGVLLAALSTAVYFLLRGELSQWPAVWRGSLLAKNVNNFLPVMLEGVAFVFLFERLNWCLGRLWALLIPSVLFAVAHIPSQVQSGLEPGGMMAFFLLNTFLPMAIFYVVRMSRDVIWIGIVHYVMDIAIGAFD